MKGGFAVSDVPETKGALPNAFTERVTKSARRRPLVFGEKRSIDGYPRYYIMLRDESNYSNRVASLVVEGKNILVFEVPKV